MNAALTWTDDDHTLKSGETVLGDIFPLDGRWYSMRYAADVVFPGPGFDTKTEAATDLLRAVTKATT